MTMETHIQTMVEALRDGLREEMARDESVILLGEDIGATGGIFHATQDLRREFGRARVWDMPLSENGIVGISIGAALGGMRPVAEIQLADFLFAAMHQIVNEAAKMRYRSRGAWSCPIVIRAPYGAGAGGGPDHSQSIEAFFAHVPGLKVVIPSSSADIKGLIKSAIRDKDPVIFLEPYRLYYEAKGEVPAGDYVIPLGKAIVRRTGTTATVITYGAMVAEALHAAEMLAEDGIEIEIIDIRTMQPLDHTTISDSVRKTNHAVVFHEAARFGGFGAEIAAFISEFCFEDLDGPVMRVGAAHLPIPAHPTLEAAVLPNAQKLAQAVRQLAAY
jgi:pyruvate/2-oxoglutarate/acetoin dehydrogenase E1 component